VNAITSSLVHSVLDPTAPSGGQHPTLLFLHGRGADEEDLLGLAPSLDPRLLIISARAPYPFPYGGGFTWYDVGDAGAPEPTMFRSSYDKLVTFIRDVHTGYPIDPVRFFLFGFSMGAVMSYALALTQPELIQGTIAHSGYIPEETSLAFRWNDLSQTEFLVVHGTQDSVIPVHLAHRAQEVLTRARARFLYREYPMAHLISNESLTDSSTWLTQHIDRGR
jgi:phospholipase/carboxylesterase